MRAGKAIDIHINHFGERVSVTSDNKVIWSKKSIQNFDYESSWIG